MTFSERAAAVASLGFTPRQAAFLTIVALHSGYCLRRQYAAFTGQHHGKNVRDFCDGLVDRHLAERLTFRADRGSIYHLFARSVYAAIGQENNRNRRAASPPQIARKLMLLDLVLSMPGITWYATETEKVDLFVSRLGVPHTALPQRMYVPHASHAASTTRYLVQKLPVFLSGDPLTVNFVCVVTDAHASDIGTFVNEHRSLLRRLPRWALHVASPAPVTTEHACNAAYHRALGSASSAPVSREDLDWYTSTRRIVDAGDLRQLAVGDLKRYRDLATRVARRADTFVAGPLIRHALPHTYAQFGSFAGVA